MRRGLLIALVGPFPPPYGGMASYFVALESSLEREGVHSRRIPVPLGTPARRLVSFLRASWQAIATRADVVHCITGSQANLLANMLPLITARVTRKPSVLSIVGGEFHGAVIGGSAIRRALLRLVVSLPTRLVACNDDIARALHDLGVPENRIVELSNALPTPDRDDVDTADSVAGFAEFAESHTPLVASVSGWYEHYGSTDLLRAAAILRQQFPRLGVALVVKEGGDPIFAKSVRSWIVSEGLEEHVLLLEDVPSVTSIMRRSSVFVRTPHLEGDSMSVREALSLGVPVVASDAGFRPGGVVLYRPADVGDLAAKLKQMLGSTKSRSHTNPELEGKANFQQLLDLYRELGAGGGFR